MRDAWILGLAAVTAAAIAGCGDGFATSQEADGSIATGSDGATFDATEEVIKVVHPDGGGADATANADVAAEADAVATGDAPSTEDADDAAQTDSASDDASTGRPDGSPDAVAVADTGGAAEAGVADAGKTTVGTVGSACSPEGATACTGNDSQALLVCQGGIWHTSSSSCTSTQRCDTLTGACAPVVAGCAGLAPGATFCTGTGPAEVIQCGVDLVTSTVAATCGARQTCTGSGGQAACTCNADPTCTVAGPTCSGSSVVTCALDGNGCAYSTGSSPCANGACYGAAGSAQCCTNGCAAAGTTCQGNTPVTCAVGPQGCLVQTQSAPCSEGTPTCSGGTCTSACGDDAGSCGTGFCCQGGTCTALATDSCGPPGGQCMDCASQGLGTACLPSGTCGCVSSNDCSFAVFGRACVGGQCGCNSASDCTGTNAGNTCNGGKCGCTSASDCTWESGLCCGPPGQTNPVCRVPGTDVSNYTCKNGTFYQDDVAGDPCLASESQPCGSLCCDMTQPTSTAYGPMGTCIASSACVICGQHGSPCCPGIAATACQAGLTCVTSGGNSSCQ